MSTMSLFGEVVMQNSWSHDARSRLPYRLHIPRTNSKERMFFHV